MRRWQKVSPHDRDQRIFASVTIRSAPPRWRMRRHAHGKTKPPLRAARSRYRNLGFAGKLATADGRIIHNAGGSEVEELGYMLSVGVAYLRALESESVALDAARRMLFFRLSADADQFLTIAKFRSLRKLWSRIERRLRPCRRTYLCFRRNGLADDDAARSAPNILRATIAVFGAALPAGPTPITVLPFTAARGMPDRFARRVARAIRSSFSPTKPFWPKVADPAAGSGAIEI